MERLRLLRPDFIVALLAVIIGLSTMVVYIYQARIMSRQVHATTWPYLEANFSEGSAGWKVSVHNKGIGPAIVKSTYLILDQHKYIDSRDSIESIVLKLLKDKINSDSSFF